MSDIALRTFGRSRHSRSGYTPLNTEQDEHDANENGGVNGDNHQTMPLQTTATKAAVSVARQNHQRWKGKKKQSYQDDPEEHEGLLEDELGHDSEDEVGRPGPARLPTHEVRPTPHISRFSLTSDSGLLRGRVPAENIPAVQKTSPELYRSGPQVCFGANAARSSKTHSSPSQKSSNRGSPRTP